MISLFMKFSASQCSQRCVVHEGHGVVIARFKQVEAAIAAGDTAPLLLRCEPVEDNLMDAGEST